MRIKDFKFNLRELAGVSLLTNMAIGFAVAVTSYYLVLSWRNQRSHC